MPTPVPHGSDIALWADQQARLLHEKRFDEIDLDHVVPVLETIGIHQRAALGESIVRLVVRLLMWKYLPGARLPSWKADIVSERQVIAGILRSSPSLRGSAAETFPETYADGRYRAAAETGIDVDLLPETPPFSFSEAQADGFLPLEPDLEAFQQASTT